ncbi:hypothetical protein HPP92_007382 [Vanilla planifolia]|uniref:Dolichol-phosphate mannosyltransferase subunit 3 n=1 Tax=Vanilla planifolia TaxID=51239 RepID=A0A835RG20_VANPL|nr:hypothetical protein HPP92_007382 [Vanilla planifolia]
MVIAGLVVVAEEPSLVARQTSSHSFGIWQKLMPKEEAAIRMVELAEINGGWNRSIDLSNRVKKLASEVLVEIARSQEVTGHSHQIKMKHFLKILGFLVTISALWIGLLEAAIVPRNYALLLPVYLIVVLGCYGLLMVGVGLMFFPICPQESQLLQKDITEAKDFLRNKGLDVHSDQNAVIQ